MRLKNAKREAAEHQRREERVPVTVVAVNTSGLDASVTTPGRMPGVNPAGLSPCGDTARTPPGVAARRTADCVCGETAVRGELYVVFTYPDGRQV